MKKLISAAVMSAGLFLGTASAAQAPSRNDFCYMQCQYQCYALYPGGGPAWTQCYIACGQTQCSGG